MLMNVDMEVNIKMDVLLLARMHTIFKNVTVNMNRELHLEVVDIEEEEVAVDLLLLLTNCVKLKRELDAVKVKMIDLTMEVITISKEIRTVVDILQLVIIIMMSRNLISLELSNKELTLE